MSRRSKIGVLAAMKTTAPTAIQVYASGSPAPTGPPVSAWEIGDSGRHGSTAPWTAAATPTSTAAASTSWLPSRSLPGIVGPVTPQGSARQVAGGIAFPNAMLVTPDNAALIVAEWYGKKLTAFDSEVDGSLSSRRVWAELGVVALSDRKCS
jgi:hypothetical protein